VTLRTQGRSPAGTTLGASAPRPVSSEKPPRLTVIVETVTHGEYEAREADMSGAASVFGALGADNTAEELSFLLVVDGKHAEASDPPGDPSIQVVPVDQPNYYSAKNAGAASATTEYVAFVDADCTPQRGWADAAISALDAGADVVAGCTRYEGSGFWIAMMNYFDFSTIAERSDGSSTGFHVNNVAFRRDVFTANPLDARLGRSGACSLLARRLRTQGRRIVYAPSMKVVHGDDYKETRSFAKRFRNGHDTVKLLRFDDEGLIEFEWISALGPIGAPLVVGRRLLDDAVGIVRRRRDLGIAAPMVPVAWLIAVPLRIMEGLAYAISSVDPSLFGRRWDDPNHPTPLRRKRR
jgi:Glycosyl transferase family 2